MTPRRVFLRAAAAAVAALRGRAAHAQEGRPWRIGYLAAGSPEQPAQVFRQALGDLGWTEQRDFVFFHRFAGNQVGRVEALASELLRQRVDVIVAVGTAAALAAKRATRTVPIVMAGVGDPVGTGLVASLARPGGNVTGVAFSVGMGSPRKALELFHEAFPALDPVGLLANPDNPSAPIAVAEVSEVARALRLRPLFLEARSPADIDAAFAMASHKGARAVFVMSESLFIARRDQLAELGLRHRIATLHGVRENVEAGGLMSYGPNLNEQQRRAAAFVVKILKGARPADLPVEQPTRFELVFNLRTARAIGVTIPPAMLHRADEVIE